MYIAVMGVTGAGKSSFISLLCDEKIDIGHDLESCTTEVGVYGCGMFPGKTLYFIDTPGFDDSKRSDTEVLRELANWLTRSYSDNVKLNGILYFHRISDIRMQGSAKKNLIMFKQLCGDDALRNVILVTSMWDRVPEKDAIMRENQLTNTPEFWGWMISKGSTTFRHDNSLSKAYELLRHFLPDITETITLNLQQEMVDEKRTLDQTSVGQELNNEILREREKFMKELNDTKGQMLKAIAQRDQESAEALREVQDDYELKLKRLQKDQDEMRITMERLQEERYNQLEAKMKAYQENLIKLGEERHAKTVEALKDQHRMEMSASTRAVREENERLKQQLDTPPLETALETLRVSRSHTRDTYAQWDTSLETLSGHQDTVSGLAFSHDYGLLASCDYAGVVKLWAPTGELLDTLTLGKGLNDMALSPNGLLLATVNNSSRSIQLLEVRNHKLTLLQTLESPSLYVNHVCFSPDSRLLASCSDENSICLWDETGGLLRVIRGFPSLVYSSAFSPDGSLLASSTMSDVSLWDPRTGKLKKKVYLHDHYGDKVLAFSPWGKILACTIISRHDSRHGIQLYSSETLSPTKTFWFSNIHWSSFAFNANGNLFVYDAADWSIKLIELESGKFERIYKVDSWGVKTIALSPDGKLLAYGTGDGTIIFKHHPPLSLSS